uniref:Uncharacterized protein n=1 Tax=Romanomermis culicivorax TaxID=13658 RepID=A0A915HRP2_ROMCU
MSRNTEDLASGTTLPRTPPGIRHDNYHHDPLDKLWFEMSQKDDEIRRLSVKIDKMADLMIGVQELLEKFNLDQREKDIGVTSEEYQMELLDQREKYETWHDLAEDVHKIDKRNTAAYKKRGTAESPIVINEVTMGEGQAEVAYVSRNKFGNAPQRQFQNKAM